MPFSSLKKSSKRSQRHYKERQQPARRAHLGQLEKKKDYVVRARDYQRKAATLKSLRQRAREKNPDEFYFHMSRSRLVDGKHTDVASTAAEKLGGGQAKAKAEAENKRIRQMLLEDANYLRHKLQIERAQLARLEAGSLAFASGPASAACRTVFDPADFRRLNRLREDAAAAADGEDAAGVVADIDGPRWAAHLASLAKADVTRLARERRRALKAARQRVARAEAIADALAKLEAKRHLAAEVGRPRKLVAAATNDRPAVWKFPFKRKR